ncbi:MAG: tetratricopeptide repeat protein [Planctomycetota bacterium]
MLRKTTMVVALVAAAVCTGCQSDVQTKKAVQERWNKTGGQMKLTVAEQQVDKGDYEQAAKTIQQCLSDDPDDPRAHLLYGRLLLADGSRSEAVEQFKLALKTDEDLYQAWYWLGVAAEETRDYRGAYVYYTQALSLEPTNVDYILAASDALVARNKTAEALELLSQKMAVLPRDVSLKVATADLVLRQGNTERAIKLYEQAALSADDTDIAESLGYCYMLAGQWEAAAEVFEKLAAQYKEDSALQKNHKMAGPDQQRRQLFLRLVGICTMNCKQYSRAVSCYSQLAVEERKNAELWLQMGQAALGARATSRALMCARKALAVRPGYADAIALLGSAQYVVRDYTAAVESFEKIATDKDSAGFSWFMRARCYEQLGQKSRAEEAYKKALDINPRIELIAYLVDRELHQEEGAGY